MQDLLFLWRRERDVERALRNIGPKSNLYLRKAYKTQSVLEEFKPLVFLHKNKKEGNRLPFCFYGGEKEIRTLVGVLAQTRFPVVRLRPTQPSLHAQARV